MNIMTHHEFAVINKLRAAADDDASRAKLEEAISTWDRNDLLDGLISLVDMGKTPRAALEAMGYFEP